VLGKLVAKHIKMFAKYIICKQTVDLPCSIFSMA
jgi:hypothetical protein